MWRNSYGLKEFFSQSDNPELREIAETMIIPKSQIELYNLFQQGLLSNGTHTILISYMQKTVLDWGWEYNHGRGFYRGETQTDISPYTGYLTSKNWHLNEEFKNLKNKLFLLAHHQTFAKLKSLNLKYLIQELANHLNRFQQVRFSIIYLFMA